MLLREQQAMGRLREGGWIGDGEVVPTFCGPGRAAEAGAGAVVAVAEFGTIEEGLLATGGQAPFLVPDCREFAVDEAGFRGLLAREQAELFGYDYYRDTEYATRYVAPLAALERLAAGTLDFVIVDAPISGAEEVLPAALRRRPPDEEGQQYACCYVLTGAGRVTPFHADPAFGGGYMHLVDGEKFWWFVDPADAPTAALVDRTVTRVLTQDDFHLWGKVRVAHLRAGGFVYTPPGWSHRVCTYAPSYGLGGYITP
jgi:hypothetical protein